jgi:type VI protein secretion system component VasK
MQVAATVCAGALLMLVGGAVAVYRQAAHNGQQLEALRGEMGRTAGEHASFVRREELTTSLDSLRQSIDLLNERLAAFEERAWHDRGTPTPGRRT